MMPNLMTNVTCSGVTGKKSPATSDWFQTVQINSVYAIIMFIAAFLCPNPEWYW